MEYEISMPAEPDEKIARMADIVMKRNKFRLLELRNKKELLKHAKELFQLLENEYKQLYGFVPLTPKQVDGYIKQYFGFVTPDFVPMVFNEKNEMVAFGIALPSLSRALQKSRGQLFPFGFIHLLNALKKNDRADLYLVAVKSEYRGSGANAILMNSMYEVFRKLGCQEDRDQPGTGDQPPCPGTMEIFRNPPAQTPPGVHQTTRVNREFSSNLPHDEDAI